MNRKLGAPLALAVTIGLGVSLGAAPASADVPTDLYVNNTATANCSDAGSGTSIQPYCTLAAAAAVVTAGQTVIVTGTYQEHLTIARSGEPGLPITFRSGPSLAQLTGPDGGITIDGQHDVTIGRISVSGARTATGIAVSNSTRITLDHTRVYVPGTSPVSPAGIHLSAVTDSTITAADTRGPLTAGILLGSATSGVTVRSSFVAAYGIADNKGIDVFGSSNTIVANRIQSADAVNIAIEAGARDNIVANNWVQSGHGRGIDNIGAIGTAITNNTVEWLCGTGIRVGEGSSGVSVQNNIAGNNGYPQSSCPVGIPDPVDIGVYGTATGDTVVDYNSVYGRGDHSYAWNTPMTLTAFRSASAQGTHDIDTSPYNTSSLNIDSANSAAPGWQGIDRTGHRVVDHPGVTNTGAGPVDYADRGASEVSGSPAARLTVTARPMGAGAVITADASGSAAWTPLTLTTYTFNFGDGTTVTQSSPIAWHVYPRNIFRRGLQYQVTVTVTDSNRSTAVAASPSTSWIYQGLPPTAPRHPPFVRTLR